MVEKSFEIFHYKDTYLNPIDYHHHDFYEIYLLLSGSVTYNIEAVSYTHLDVYKRQGQCYGDTD